MTSAILTLSQKEYVMYYSSGNYEASAHPRKPKDADMKSAYIIGTGLAGLTAAFYLVRDGQIFRRLHPCFRKLTLLEAAAMQKDVMRCPAREAAENG